MNRWKLVLLVTALAVATAGLSAVTLAAATTDELVAICNGLYPAVYGVPNGEPLGACQWDMALINASEAGSYDTATGAGVKVGIIDGGVDFDDTISQLPFLLGADLQDYVFIAPSFRAEPLVFDGTTYQSAGPASPWDRDVDDALALINVVAATTPEADLDQIGVVGFSRGACVALLMAVRDPRIDLVVEFFGPTDFFGPFVQDVLEEALLGSLRELPALETLYEQFILPLKNGEITIADMRPELVRRSPVYFADRLPQLQVHHGTADETVPVGEAERLIEVMMGLGRSEPEFEWYLYEGGGHDPLLPGAIGRTRDFLSRLVSPLIATLAP